MSAHPARRVLALAALALAIGGSAAAQEYEFKMISSGPNRPGIGLWRAPYRDILVGLHDGVPRTELAALLHLDGSRLSAALDSLAAEGAVSGKDGRLRPTCMVVTAEEGVALQGLATEIASEALPFLLAAVRALAETYRDVRGLAHLPFDDVSFFLASDVLLDNWQINAVERRWLESDRPLRGAARYYCALFARPDAPEEAFGIYGNQMVGLGDGRTLGVYGNRRGGRSDLSRLPRSELARMLATSDTSNRQALLRQLVDELQRAPEDQGATVLRPAFGETLATLGLMRQGRPLFAVLDPDDLRRLDALAASVTDSLVAHLDRATPRLRQAWTQSRWHAETTFEEFGIWWYHFFYTALTDQLAAAGAIRIPETGLFHYLMVR